jgi:mono/diheme cytochrome c family protein
VVVQFWLERRPVTPEVAGSSPVHPATSIPAREFSPGRFHVSLMFLFFFTSIVLAGQPTKRLPDVDRGGELYMRNCWMCHGKKGRGNGPAAEAFPSESPAIAKTIDRQQWEGALRVIMDGRGDMPAFSQVIDRRDAKRILTWLEDPTPVKPRKSTKEAKPKKATSSKTPSNKNRKRD